MIYLDTSVALAELFAEDRRPPESLWGETLVASRLLRYELWTRVHARGATDTHGAGVDAILARVSLVELVPPVLARALEPFPLPVRTLDALHLATLHHVIQAGQRPSLASFDERMRRVAIALGWALAF